MRLSLSAFAVALALAAPSASAPINDDPAARPALVAQLPDGRKINFRCEGQGAPTVLLEGGYGANSLGWSKVKALVGPSHRVCSYDRAGAGFSDPGPLPRDGAAIAADLDGALRAADIRGPYVLVGHSAGALYMRLFSNRRPGEIAGMVLVDPSVEHQDQRFAARFGPGAGGVEPLIERASICLLAADAGQLPSSDPSLANCVPQPRGDISPALNASRAAESLRASTWQARVSELENLWGPTSDQLSAGRQSYGDLPLIVLTADGTYASAPEPYREPLASLWRDLHRELAGRSGLGVERVVVGSSHMMTSDKPDVVAAAILEVADQAKVGGDR